MMEPGTRYTVRELAQLWGMKPNSANYEALILSDHLMWTRAYPQYTRTGAVLKYYYERPEGTK